MVLDLRDGVVGDEVAVRHPARIRDEDEVDLARRAQGGLEGVEPDEGVRPVPPRGPALVLDDRADRRGQHSGPRRADHVEDEEVPLLRLHAPRELLVHDGLVRREAGAVPGAPVPSDEAAEVCGGVEPEDRRLDLEEPRSIVERGPGQVVPRGDPVDVGHRGQVRPQVGGDPLGEGREPAPWRGEVDEDVRMVHRPEDGASDRVAERGLDHEGGGDDRGPDEEARHDDRDLGLPPEEVPQADPKGEAPPARPAEDGQDDGRDEDQEGKGGVHGRHLTCPSAGRTSGSRRSA